MTSEAPVFSRCFLCGRRRPRSLLPACSIQGMGGGGGPLLGRARPGPAGFGAIVHSRVMAHAGSLNPSPGIVSGGAARAHQRGCSREYCHRTTMTAGTQLWVQGVMLAGRVPWWHTQPRSRGYTHACQPIQRSVMTAQERQYKRARTCDTVKRGCCCIDQQLRPRPCLFGGAGCGGWAAAGERASYVAIE